MFDDFFKKAPKPKSEPDYTLITLIAILTIFGLVMLASASSDIAKMKFGNSYFYITHQLIYGLSIGLIGFFVGSTVYYQRWKKVSVLLLVLNIIALILVFTPIGVSAQGATRWLNIGGVSFQPGEALKISFLIYLSAWISKRKKRSKSFTKGLLPFSILTGGVVFLLLAQPSTGTAAIIFGTSLVVYFISGAKAKFVTSLILIALVAFAGLVYTSPYRMERIKTFLNPTKEKLESSYHINQALTAIGSGGITGVGYGQSTTKINYLPEPIGDSIFAVIAEELGFAGSFALILMFGILVWRGIKIARKVPDSFGKLLTVGFATLIGFQAFVNIGAISGLIPLTGVPLPFISYGGTALAVFLTMSGIMVNVSRYRK
ncbi:MAG: putative lipid II flippase FtsW [Candidatus Magasanikbacteria bacterium]